MTDLTSPSVERHVDHGRDLEPAAWLHELLERRPLHQEAAHAPPFIVLSRFDDVLAALKQPEVWQNGDGPGVFSQRGGVLGSADDPDHARQRRVLRPAFLPSAMKALRPRVEALADELAADFVERGCGDFVDLYAFPFPALVVGELLGVHPEDREDFKRWSVAVVNALGGGDLTAYENATHSIWEYVDARLAEREALLPAGGDLDESLLGTALPDDLISRMLLAVLTGELSRLEARRLGHQLLVAGHETTTSLIALLFYRFAQRPDLAEQVRSDPSVIDAAIEEGLRFDSPVQGLFRTNACPARLRGQEIPERTKVQLLFAAANRDPRHWEDPDAFRLDRDPRQQRSHLAFGWGVHHCIGAPVARLETRVTLERLLPRMADLELEGEPETTETFILRGLTKLPLRWRPVPARREQQSRRTLCATRLGRCR
jgi:cytochrome P450